MLKYVIKRILLMFFVLLVTFAICFTLIRLLPLPDISHLKVEEKAIIEARREALGYNKPIPEQFVIFLKNIITEWNWGIGESGMYKFREVSEVFAEKLPATMVVNLWSIILSIPIGIFLGILAALKKNTWIDHLISTLTMVSISVPSFVYAFLVQYIFCFKLKWFPFEMAEGKDYFSWEMFRSMCPAILALSFGTIAGFTRVTRAELTEVMTGDYMLLARTKGLTKRQAISRHALKNCMVVILPAIFGSFIGIMGGSLVIEKIFNIPGVGKLYLASINTLEYNFFMMLSAFYSFIGLAAGIVVDISYGLIDPRIRMGSRK